MKWLVLFIGAIATTRTDRNVLDDLTSIETQAAGHSRRDDQAFSGFWNESPGKDFQQKIEKVVAPNGVIQDADGSDATSESKQGVSRKVAIEPSEISSYLQRSSTTEASDLMMTGISIDQVNRLMEGHPLVQAGIFWKGCGLAGRNPSKYQGNTWYQREAGGANVNTDATGIEMSSQIRNPLKAATWAETQSAQLMTSYGAAIDEWKRSVSKEVALLDERPSRSSQLHAITEAIVNIVKDYMLQDMAGEVPPKLKSDYQNVVWPVMIGDRFPSAAAQTGFFKQWAMQLERAESMARLSARQSGRPSARQSGRPPRLPAMTGSLKPLELTKGGPSIELPSGSTRSGPGRRLRDALAASQKPDVSVALASTSKLASDLNELIKQCEMLLEGFEALKRDRSFKRALDSAVAPIAVAEEDDGILGAQTLHAESTRAILDRLDALDLHKAANNMLAAVPEMSTVMKSAGNLRAWITNEDDGSYTITAQPQCEYAAGKPEFEVGDTLLSVQKVDAAAPYPLIHADLFLDLIEKPGTVVTFKRRRDEEAAEQVISKWVSEHAKNVAEKLLTEGVDAGMISSDGTLDELEDEQFTADQGLVLNDEDESRLNAKVSTTEWLPPDWPPEIQRGPRAGERIKRKGEYTTGILFNDWSVTPATVKSRHLDENWDIVYLRCMKGGHFPEGDHRCLWTTKGGNRGKFGGSIEGVWVDLPPANRSAVVFERVRCSDVPRGQCTRCCDPVDNAWRAGDMYKRVWGPPPYLASGRNKKANIAPFHSSMWGADKRMEVTGKKGALGTAGRGERE